MKPLFVHPMHDNKKIILAITGSIAAYKSVLLLRLLTQQGHQVKILMTPAAEKFVSPLVLSTLSTFPVLNKIDDDNEWANHVSLGHWADLMLIAPLTCNTLAKMAHGLCDNLLMAVYLSASNPVLVAPAMDEEMWKHPATQQNIAIIKKHGVQVLDVAYGVLGSGLVGDGRMQEPQAIVEYVNTL